MSKQLFEMLQVENSLERNFLSNSIGRKKFYKYCSATHVPYQ